MYEATLNASPDSAAQDARLRDAARLSYNIQVLADADMAGYSHISTIPSSRQPRQGSSKFDYIAVSILVVGPILLLATMSWIGFLWFASDDNDIRHLVLVNNWLTRLITVSALVVRTAGSLMSGISTAMLAALALEHGRVLLLDAAAVSMVRAARSNSLLAPLLLKLAKTRSPSFTGVLWLGLGLLLLLTTTAIQFSSLILMTDVQVVDISGFPSAAELPYGFNYTDFTTPPYPRVEMRVGAWFRKPPFYPTFAEYREEPIQQDGVSDTGLTLRALVPSLSASSRETLQQFLGTTTVLDTRVTCQRPRLLGLNATLPTNSKAVLLNGQVWSDRETPRLVNFTTQWGYADGAAGTSGADGGYEIDRVGVWFNCSAANNASHSPGALFESDLLFLQWRTSICQLGTWSGDAYGGGLLPEFFQFPPSPQDFEGSGDQVYNSTTAGSAYLVLNVTSGLTDDWDKIPNIASGVPPTSTGVRGEWVDLQFQNSTLSVTLCYTAFGSAEEPVTITGNTKRTEPEPRYDRNTSLLTFEDIRLQLGQDRQRSPEERGLLRLSKKDSWLSNNTQTGRFNYIEMFADGAGLQQYHQWGATPNFTVVLYDWATTVTASGQTAMPEKTHIHLFQEIVTSGGTVAFALQSILTVLGTMAYYDQMLQFDESGLTKQVFLIPCNVPTTHRGFVIISVLLTLHLIVVWTIAGFFGALSSFSSLHHSEWQAVAHIVARDTQEILLRASDPAISGKEIMKTVKASGREKMRVQIGLVDEVLDAGRVHRRVGLHRARI